MPPTSIPADIWVHVAKFVPGDDLRDMLSINSTLFQLAMDLRYRDACFILAEHSALERMRRLRNPIIAHRVRKLHVDLRPRAKECPPNTDDEAPKPPRPSPGKAIQTMTAVVPHLINVTEFCVEWTHLPTGEHVALLTKAWNTFGPGLRKLTFKVPLIHLPNLLCSADGPMTLRNLDLDLCGNVGVPKKIDEAESPAIANSLAQFVNKVAPTLRGLSVTSRVRHLWISPFLRQLRNIPNLEQFSYVADNVSDPRVLDPLGFTCLLRNHAATLCHLHWSGMPLVEQHAGDVKPNEGDSEGQRISSWLRENGLDEVFSNLLTLELPVPTSSRSFVLMQQWIKTSASTLTSLSLHSRYLSYGQVNTLASTFSNRNTGYLRDLSFRVEFMSPELVVLLARGFPRLEKLKIEISHVAAQDGMGQINPTNNDEELAISRDFADAMKNCDVPHWSLRDITIVMHAAFDKELHTKLMRVLAERFPSIETFGGMDKEIYACITL